MNDEIMECGHKGHRYAKVPRCLDCEDALRASCAEMAAKLAAEEGRHEFTVTKWQRERKELTDALVSDRRLLAERDEAVKVKLGWEKHAYELECARDVARQGQADQVQKLNQQISRLIDEREAALGLAKIENPDDIVKMVALFKARAERAESSLKAAGEALEKALTEAQIVAFEYAANCLEQWAIAEACSASKNQDAEHAYEQAQFTFENKAKALRAALPSPTKASPTEPFFCCKDQDNPCHPIGDYCSRGRPAKPEPCENCGGSGYAVHAIDINDPCPSCAKPDGGGR